LSKEESQELLTGQPSGTFLIRCSQSSPDCLAMAEVMPDKQIVHSLLKRVTGGYTVGDATVFPTVRELV